MGRWARRLRPGPPEGVNLEVVLEGNGEGTEALATPAVEPHRGLRVGVAWPPWQDSNVSMPAALSASDVLPDALVHGPVVGSHVPCHCSVVSRGWCGQRRTAQPGRSSRSSARCARARDVADGTVQAMPGLRYARARSPSRAPYAFRRQAPTGRRRGSSRRRNPRGRCYSP